MGLRGLVSVKPWQHGPCPLCVAVVLSEVGTPDLHSQASESPVRVNVHCWLKIAVVLITLFFNLTIKLFLKC